MVLETFARKVPAALAATRTWFSLEVMAVSASLVLQIKLWR